MSKRQVKVSESLFDRVDLARKALALPPIVFCRKVRLPLVDLCSERRDMGSKCIAFGPCAGEIAVEVVYHIAFSEHLFTPKLFERADLD
jgi:hypothetical protein